ncbi:MULTISPECIES: hypothetical protein [unclassified Pseudomonas]|uniref:hypothetical protein n=1 Tax=unclassified Pseudomonas TaxID=196821 RepID=UPI0002A211B8|nr:MULTISPECIES: hypothetical protein [unclassified Pseudomonas]NTX87965.1 hypothetical protein [Pseudomonas sp. UMA643]NTY17009.1 hypothetical protein [Pseudomonas sp. UMC3103]NTY22888.1 hypothetical protein [Pseudomonas sp. UMA603]NTY29529.1 hypothetical protein [Pseudomonas sp. UMC3129]NTY52603.1 hypothetical protein [Pseudomonas sp. UMC631]
MQKLPFLASLALMILWGAAQSHATINTNCIAQKPKVVCNIAWREGCKTADLKQVPSCQADVKESAGKRAVEVENSPSVLLEARGAVALTERIDPPVEMQMIKSPIGDLKPSESIPDKLIKDKADGVLTRLDTNPLDDAAQGEARSIIRACNSSENAKTPRKMFQCSGFLVTPIVRLNCVGNGACIPTEWPFTENNGAAPRSAWALEIAYDQIDTSLNDNFAFARPWVASDKDIQDCRAKALVASAEGADERTIQCLTLRMGGIAAQRAMDCFKKFPDDPVNFAGCLSDVKIDSVALKQANCVLNGDQSDACLSALGVSSEKIQECRSTALGNDTAAQTCITSLPRQIGPTAECVRAYRGDISATAHCISGVAKIGGPKATAAFNCGMELANAGTSADTQQKVFNCLGRHAPGVAKYSTTIGKYKGTIDCLQDPSKDLEAKAQCARDAGLPFPKELELAQCTAQAASGAQLAKCAGVMGAAAVAAMEHCIRESGNDNTRRTLCVGMQVGLPPEERRVLECAATSRGAADGIVCIAGPKLPAQVAKVASCAANSQGSPAGTAICLAGPSMNAELRIAAECASTTGGEPMSFASCAGGRLAMKELQQCVAGGFKAENGCFGENNEIVKYFKAQEALLRNTLRIVGLESGYQHMLNDLKNGKLGENNEITRILRLMNDIATKPPAETINNAVEEAKKAGTLVVDGAAKLNEELNKVQKQASQAVENAMPRVPPVTAKTDIPGGGSVEVKVGPMGGTVTVGNKEVSLGSSPHVKVGGVCIGFGC